MRPAMTSWAKAVSRSGVLFRDLLLLIGEQLSLGRDGLPQRASCHRGEAELGSGGVGASLSVVPQFSPDGQVFCSGLVGLYIPSVGHAQTLVQLTNLQRPATVVTDRFAVLRSEERRVGKGCTS